MKLLKRHENNTDKLKQSALLEMERFEAAQLATKKQVLRASSAASRLATEAESSQKLLALQKNAIEGNMSYLKSRARELRLNSTIDDNKIVEPQSALFGSPQRSMINMNNNSLLTNLSDVNVSSFSPNTNANANANANASVTVINPSPTSNKPGDTLLQNLRATAQSIKNVDDSFQGLALKFNPYIEDDSDSNSEVTDGAAGHTTPSSSQGHNSATAQTPNHDVLLNDVTLILTEFGDLKNQQRDYHQQLRSLKSLNKKQKANLQSKIGERDGEIAKVSEHSRPYE